MLPILRTPGHLLKRLLGSDILALLGDIVPLLKKLSALVDSRRLQGIYDVLCQQRTIAPPVERGGGALNCCSPVTNENTTSPHLM